jgi:hypothetical protein
MRGPWAARDMSMRIGVLIALLLLMPVGRSSKKILDVDFQQLGDPHHRGRAHAVSALLVFLDLLERDAKGFGKLGLTQRRHHDPPTRS